VINKIDLPHANAEAVSRQIEQSLGIPKERHLLISAKSGLGVDKVLQGIVDYLPPPKAQPLVDSTVAGAAVAGVPDASDRLQALVVDT
jgi:translation elongation factor EF-4